MAQTVSDVMQPDPICVETSTSIRAVATTMRDQGIGDVLVVDNGTLLGIVTDRDIVVRAIAAGEDAENPISGCVTTELATVGPDDPVEEAARRMREQAVRRIPVVDGARPVGIVSLGDLAIEGDADAALTDISAAPPNN